MRRIALRVGQKAFNEARRLFWIFLYLWALLGLFSIYKSLILHENNLFFHEGFALINAWVLAKVILTAEMFHVGDRFHHKPLIFPVVFKSAISAALLMFFYFLEGILVGIWRGKALDASVPAVGDGTLRGVFAVSFITFVVLMPFFALREIGRDIGDDKLFELFFRRRTKLTCIS